MTASRRLLPYQHTALLLLSSTADLWPSVYTKVINEVHCATWVEATSPSRCSLREIASRSACQPPHRSALRVTSLGELGASSIPTRFPRHRMHYIMEQQDVDTKILHLIRTSLEIEGAFLSSPTCAASYRAVDGHLNSVQ